MGRLDAGCKCRRQQGIPALLEALTPFLRMVVRQGFTRAGLSGGDVEDVVQETCWHFI